MPTKLYFRAASPGLSGTLPTNEQSTATPTWSATGATTLRSLQPTPGTAQTSLAGTTSATTAAQRGFLGYFASQPLPAGTVLGGGSITLNVADAEGNNAANFWVNALNVYIWRPSTGAKVGVILDSAATSLGGTEGGTGQTVTHITGISSSAVSAAANDVVIVEIWGAFTQSMATSYSATFFYDGTTENTTENASVTNHASYIEFAENIPYPVEVTVALTEEAVDDTASISVDPIVSTSLAISESVGADTVVITAETVPLYADVIINVTETGTDTASVSVKLLVQTSISSTEVGADTAVIDVRRLIDVLFTSLTESGIDTANISVQRVVPIPPYTPSGIVFEIPLKYFSEPVINRTVPAMEIPLKYLTESAGSPREILVPLERTVAPMQPESRSIYFTIGDRWQTFLIDPKSDNYSISILRG